MRWPIVFALLLGTLACVPPPYRVLDERDPDARASLARDSRWQLSRPASPARLVSALMAMGCRITASDGTTGLLSFERTQHTRGDLGNPMVVVWQGTLQYEPETRRVQLLLGAKSWLVIQGEPHQQEWHARLSAEDHRAFLRELSAQLE